MSEYSNSKIYKISDANSEMVYIGSTTMPLKWRMACHKSTYLKHPNKLSVHKIFNKYGFQNCKIELVEEHPCENRKQLEKREGEIMKSMLCVNKCIAGKNQKENKKEYFKEYYISNKDKLLNYAKQLYQKKKEENKRQIEKLKEYTLNEQQQLNTLLSIMDEPEIDNDLAMD